MATSPLTFNGTSTFSSSFQTVLNNAVQLASLPQQAMQSELSTLNSQNNALVTLEGDFSGLQTAIQAVGSAVLGNASASVSNSSAITANASSSALNGTYSIQVDNVGSSTITLSQAGVPPITDPTVTSISASPSLTLTLDGTSSTITPSGGSLEDLANAINAAGVGVQATIVNVGSNTSADYRLALTSTHLGPDTISLSDTSGNNLLSTLSTGSLASYQVNGVGTEIQSNSSQVTLAPGLTVNLLQTTTSPVTVTVSSNYNSLQSALSNLATAYNQAVGDLGQQSGQSGGALAGQSVIYSLENTLRQISTFSSGSGSVHSLSDLGFTLSEAGQLSFNPSSFSSANIADVQQFLGTTTTSGFLNSANTALTAMTDPNVGILQSDSNTLQSQITSENSQIADQQVLINNLETNLQTQLSAADASIAALQAQSSYYTALFNAENTNSLTQSGHSSGG